MQTNGSIPTPPRSLIPLSSSHSFKTRILHSSQSTGRFRTYPSYRSSRHKPLPNLMVSASKTSNVPELSLHLKETIDRRHDEVLSRPSFALVCDIYTLVTLPCRSLLVKSVVSEGDEDGAKLDGAIIGRVTKRKCVAVVIVRSRSFDVQSDEFTQVRIWLSRCGDGFTASDSSQILIPYDSHGRARTILPMAYNVQRNLPNLSDLLRASFVT